MKFDRFFLKSKQYLLSKIKTHSYPSKISLLVVDALRYDCINYLQLTSTLKRDGVLEFLDTPTMNELCKDSICFTNCYSTSAATSQVLASMFTGTTPINHGITHNSPSAKITLSKEIITLAEIFKNSGYMTVLTGEPAKHLKTQQIFRGFDFDFSKNDMALFEFLNKHKEKKIFLFGLFEDVHAPYLHSIQPPTSDYNDDVKKIMSPIFEENNVSYSKDITEVWIDLFNKNKSRKLWFPLYVKGVSKFDKGRFQIFIDQLKKSNFLKRNDSLMILTADHGEGKCFHSEPETFTHGGDAYDDNIRVPLIVRLPKLKHEIRKELVSNVDVFKIILDSVKIKNIHPINQKLYCINPFNQTRDFSWYIFSVGLAKGNYAQYRLYARTIITTNKKFTLRGKPELFLNPNIFETENSDFIQKLYSNFFICETSDDQLNEQLAKLENRLTKKELYEWFVKDGQKVPKCFIMDIKNDPFEENPIDPFKDELLTSDYLKWFETMIDIDRPQFSPRSSEFQLTDEEKATEEEIKKELQKLGYL